MAIVTFLPGYDLSKIPEKTGDQTNEEFMESADYFVDYVTGAVPLLESMRVEANILAGSCNIAAITAMAGGNYAGSWFSLSGELEMGKVVYKKVGDQLYWIARYTIQNVETHEPGVDTGAWWPWTVPLDTVNTLATYTPSNAAVVDVTNTVISSVYQLYEIQMHSVIPATDNAQFLVRTSTDNGTSFASGASDYDWTVTGAASADDTAMKPLGSSGVGSDTNEFGITGSMWLYSPLNTTRYKVLRSHLSYTATTGALTSVSGFARRKNISAINAIRIAFSTGNIETGTIIVRGHR